MNRQRRSLVILGALVALALLASSAVPASAGGRVVFGFGFGFPLGYPYPYPYPYAYPYPYPAYSPPVVIQSPPPVYVEQEPPAAQAPAQYWYYCQASQAYYPYVRECPAGWMQVVPQVGPTAPPEPPR